MAVEASQDMELGVFCSVAPRTGALPEDGNIRIRFGSFSRIVQVKYGIIFSTKGLVLQTYRVIGTSTTDGR
jgi:hypothetical protein